MPLDFTNYRPTLSSGDQQRVAQAQRDLEHSLIRQVQRALHVPKREARGVVTHMQSLRAPDVIKRTREESGQNGVVGAVTANKMPFQLIDASTVSGGVTTHKIRIVRSMLDGGNPDFPGADTPFVDGDEPPCVFTVTTSGVIYAHVTIDHTAATPELAITSTELAFAATKPDDTDTEKYEQIGSWLLDDVGLTVSNDRFGPVYVDVCRNWFTATKHYGINFR